MRTMALLGASLILLLSASSAGAETLPLFSSTNPPPATYTPGVPFSFQIVVPPIAGLSAYSSTLIFETFTVTSPDITVTVTPTSQYVFGSSGFTSNFSSNLIPNQPDDTAVSFYWSDSIAPNTVSTAMGVNDVLGMVTVTPGSDLSVPIDISFSQDPTQTFVNYASEDLNNSPDTTVYEVDPLASPAASVPGPQAWITLTLGVLFVVVRSHFLRRPNYRLS